MTREEFDTWITQHYGELLAVAKARGAGDDALQTALLSALANETYLRCRPDAAWTWFANAVRGCAKNERRGNARRHANRVEFKRVQGAGLYQGWKRPAPRAE